MVGFSDKKTGGHEDRRFGEDAGRVDGLHPHRPRQRKSEGLADGAVGFVAPGPDGVGGVLDGGAAGVEDMQEAVTVESGEFLFLDGVGLAALVVVVGGEEGRDGGEFFPEF